jgi:hypothetical protein
MIPLIPHLLYPIFGRYQSRGTAARQFLRTGVLRNVRTMGDRTYLARACAGNRQGPQAWHENTFFFFNEQCEEVATE